MSRQVQSVEQLPREPRRSSPPAMRLLHVIASIRAAGGGPAEAVRSLSTVHLRHGHSIEVASLDDPADEEVRSFPLPLHALGPGRNTYSFAPAFVPWLRQNRARYDAVIVNGLWQYHSFGAWRALRGTPTPYYVFPHGMLDPWFKRTFPLKHLKKSLYWPWADYRVLRDASAVLFTCEAEKLLAPSSFALYRAHPVVTGLGTTPPPPDVDTTAFFDRYPDLRGKRLLLFMGRLHPKKGCDILVDAYAATMAKDPAWRLVFAGPDDFNWRQTLVARANALDIAESHRLDRHAPRPAEMECARRRRGIRTPLAPGKLRHRGRRIARLRGPCRHLTRSQHLARNRSSERRLRRPGHRRRNDESPHSMATTIRARARRYAAKCASMLPGTLRHRAQRRAPTGSD